MEKEKITAKEMKCGRAPEQIGELHCKHSVQIKDAMVAK